MLALGFNFVSTRRRVSLVAVTAALAGLLALVAVGMDYLDTRTSVARAEVAVERLQRGQRPGQVRPPAAGAPAAQPADGLAAERVLAQLQLPWGTLLDVLEAETGPSIALLGLDVQGAGRSVRITGEAAAMGEVLAYVRRLRGSALLTAVALSGHEERASGAPRTVRFVLDIRWGAAP